jgi:hypothetical protein
VEWDLMNLSNIRVSHGRKAARLIAVAGAIAAPLALAGIAEASVLVVRSSGPTAKNYRPGKTLPDDAKVALALGDVLVVLAQDSARTLRGPGTFSLSEPRSSMRPAVNPVRRGRFSSLRNAGIVPRSPTLWHVDVSQDGRVCIADPADVQLWRPDPSKAVTLSITGPAGDSGNAQWAAGQATLDWPAGVPVRSGGEYQLDWQGKGKPTRVTFATLPSVPTDVTGVAQALISANCSSQLELLINTVPTEPTPPSSQGSKLENLSAGSCGRAAVPASPCNRASALPAPGAGRAPPPAAPRGRRAGAATAPRRRRRSGAWRRSHIRRWSRRAGSARGGRRSAAIRRGSWRARP